MTSCLVKEILIGTKQKNKKIDEIQDIKDLIRHVILTSIWSGRCLLHQDKTFLTIS